MIMDLREFPIANGMIKLAQRLKSNESGNIFMKYMCLWSGFNNIYQCLADRDGLGPKLDSNKPFTKRRPLCDYILPNIVLKSEQNLILNAVRKLSCEQKKSLLCLGQVEFFVNRTPQGVEGTSQTEISGIFDSQGQRINGVLNRTRTISPLYPHYAPIDMEKYQSFLAGDQTHIDLLCAQLVILLYVVRNNLMHGHKETTRENDPKVVSNAYPILEFLVSCFVKI